MIQIPAGRFRMGSKNGRKNELPLHEVSLATALWMSKTPVTQRQWQAVMDTNPSHFKEAGPDAPVEQVSMSACELFLSRTNEAQGDWAFRLPTEAEWEFACRGGSQEETYGELDAVAWHAGNSERTTHPVRGKKPNAYGLCDMLGNVWQWCADLQHDDYQQAPSDGQAWIKDSYLFDATRANAAWTFVEATFVTRGGSWREGGKAVRAAYRNMVNGTSAYNDLGLRLVAQAKRSTWAGAQPQHSGLGDRTPVSGAVRNAAGLWEVAIPFGKTSINMIQIPAGRFTMGSQDGRKNERPVHEVVIAHSFWMSKTLITQQQWLSIMRATPSRFQSSGPHAPVESVNITDCEKFVAYLNGDQTQWNFRLPSEAEWEFACRAGATSERNGDLDVVAWYASNSGGITHPVGLKQANAFGLCDMLGNVWQWCADLQHDTYQDAPVDGKPWIAGSYFLAKGPKWSGDGGRVPVGHSRFEAVNVIRGGSWKASASKVRAAYRDTMNGSTRADDVGLRLVAVPSE